jgi:uncharacterized membrane protein
MESPSKEILQSWHDDANNWKWGIFYFNPKDKRIFIDKPNPDFGTTLNFANPKSYLVVAIALLFFGFILYMITKKAS